MLNHETQKSVEFSFIMAPFYLIEDDILLKAQLKNLANQTNKNFEVVIPDPHFNKRGWLGDFVKKTEFNVLHFPYKINNNIPKTFDYGIFNSAALMSNSNKLVTFQDWRFCNPLLVETLIKLNEYDFVGFLWQILYKKDDTLKSTGHSVSTVDISEESAEIMYSTGNFPNLEIEEYFVDNFRNESWGHYCINKDLWLEINGIDEVSTNTRHYADLDMNCRLNELYRVKDKKIKIPMLKNAMVRMMHNKGKYFGGSNVPIDFEVNENHKNCCFSTKNIEPWGPINWMNDKKFTHYVIDKIKIGQFTKLYETQYSEDFKKNNKNESLDSEFSVIGFQCNECGVIAETPHWYQKSPQARIKSMCNIGIGQHKLGRDLNEISKKLINKTFEEKVNIINDYSN